MKINASNGGSLVYRRILAAGLLLAVAAVKSPGQAPDPCPDLTNAMPPVTTLPITSCGDALPQGNFVRVGQMPKAPVNGQFVYGTLDFTTDGKTPVYNLSPTSTRFEEEHSLWCLQYYRDGTASRLRTNVVQWIHRTMDTVMYFTGGPNTKVVTLNTRTLVGNVQPIGQSTLMIANILGQYGTYRGLSMSSGESLPSIMVQEVTRQFVYPRGGSVCQEIKLSGGLQQHPMTAFLQINDEWIWGTWASPYSGKIETMNSYIDYLIKPPPGAKQGTKGTPWLAVSAVWNTHP